jgi:hypothetical protein
MFSFKVTYDVLFQIAEELDRAALHPLSLSIISSQRLQRRPPLLCDKCVLVPDTALRWKLSLPREDSSANFFCFELESSLLYTQNFLLDKGFAERSSLYQKKTCSGGFTNEMIFS